MVGHQSDMWLLISDRLARPDLVDVGELGGQAGGGGRCWSSPVGHGGTVAAPPRAGPSPRRAAA